MDAGIGLYANNYLYIFYKLEFGPSLSRSVTVVRFVWSSASQSVISGGEKATCSKEFNYLDAGFGFLLKRYILDDIPKRFRTNEHVHIRLAIQSYHACTRSRPMTRLTWFALLSCICLLALVLFAWFCLHGSVTFGPRMALPW